MTTVKLLKVPSLKHLFNLQQHTSKTSDVMVYWVITIHTIIHNINQFHNYKVKQQLSGGCAWVTSRVLTREVCIIHKQ